ncbi:YggT family protein [Caulobacter sp. NIBR2454]|uniref:YggT family protein n=1 Tax=Caulobacter sp. NIBR2454 TaxID=3015996 RepID=UPI0022B67B2B|nr:YggT family protein [Caulobacter sp. NIBR2454]
MGYAIVWLVNTIISLLIFLIFARAIVSWLVAFDIINTRNRFVYQVLTMLERITDPILRPLQRVLPTLGGIDISPIVAWLLLQFIQIIFNRTLAPIIVGALG